jgi:crotonobetainyl-CoA:carnitine CoA-transferase CaiB-like acyl-CoA transferase
MFRDIPIGDASAMVVNHPLRYDGAQPPLRRVPIEVGQDTRDILETLGFDQARIDALASAGVIVTPDSCSPRAEVSR